MIFYQAVAKCQTRSRHGSWIALMTCPNHQTFHSVNPQLINKHTASRPHTQLQQRIRSLLGLFHKATLTKPQRVTTPTQVYPHNKPKMKTVSALHGSPLTLNITQAQTILSSHHSQSMSPPFHTISIITHAYRANSRREREEGQPMNLMSQRAKRDSSMLAGMILERAEREARLDEFSTEMEAILKFLLLQNTIISLPSSTVQKYCPQAALIVAFMTLQPVGLTLTTSSSLRTNLLSSSSFISPEHSLFSRLRGWLVVTAMNSWVCEISTMRFYLGRCSVGGLGQATHTWVKELQELVVGTGARGRRKQPASSSISPPNSSSTHTLCMHKQYHPFYQRYEHG